MSGSNGGSVPVQPTYTPSLGQPHMITEPHQRPPLRRADSRGGPTPLRHPIQNPNLQTQPNPHQIAPNQVPMNRPLQPRPPQPGTQYIATRPPLNQPQRFPNQMPPQRHIPPENMTPNNQDQRRVINSSSPEGYQQQRPQVPLQKPLQQGPIQPSTRPPSVSNQPRPLSGSIQPVQSSFDQTYKKTPMETENYSYQDEPDRFVKEKPNISQIKNLSFSQSKNDLASPIVEDKQFLSDNRSSSSLGHHQDPEKDVDTSILNGKTKSIEDVIDRQFKEATLPSNMNKIEEDDDDSVITPSRNLRPTVANENIYNEQNKAKITSEMKPPPTYMQDKSKFPASTKASIPQEIKPNHSQPQNYSSYNTENTPDSKYIAPTNNETDFQYKTQIYNNDNDVVPASVKNITNEPRVSSVSPQKPNLILNPTNKKPPIVPDKINQPGNDTWAPTKESIKSPVTLRGFLSPTSNPNAPRDKDRKVTSPRMENNNMNRRGYSAKSQRSGVVLSS